MVVTVGLGILLMDPLHCQRMMLDVETLIQWEEVSDLHHSLHSDCTIALVRVLLGVELVCLH